MSHGFAAFNAAAQQIVGTEATVLNLIASGSTIDMEAAHAAAVTAANVAGFNQLNRWEWFFGFNSFPPHTNRGGQRIEHMQIACPGLTHAAVGSRAVIVPVPVANVEPGDTLFYQIGSVGVTRAAQFNWDLPDAAIPNTMTSILYTRSQTPVPYRIIGPRVVGSLPGTWGMQTFREDASLAFDSRAPVLPVRYAFILTQAQMDDILDNEAAVTVTLPEPMPDCWVGAPFFSPFYFNFYERSSSINRYEVRVIALRQASSTTLTFSCEKLNNFDTPGDSGTASRIYTHDAVFYVARNIS